MKNLNLWLDFLEISFFSFVNVSSRVGSISKNDWELDFLELCSKGNTGVISLGKVASVALDTLNIPHYELPHPSPLNRQLNDREFMMTILRDCKLYIKEHDA